MAVGSISTLGTLATGGGADVIASGNGAASGQVDQALGLDNNLVAGLIVEHSHSDNGIGSGGGGSNGHITGDLDQLALYDSGRSGKLLGLQVQTRIELGVDIADLVTLINEVVRHYYTLLFSRLS